MLDPNAFTIGFARRFATYKRATLLFRDVARLKRILCNPEMPVQIVIAGKAHPKDHPGKSLSARLCSFRAIPICGKHLVFIEDYDMKVAREMVQGVDLWLNNPRRGEEACGTSGMKAAINGVLNLSVLDGWFDEAYENSGGWAIGDRIPIRKTRTKCTLPRFIHFWKTNWCRSSTTTAIQTKHSHRMGAPHEECITDLTPRFGWAACGGIHGGALPILLHFLAGLFQEFLRYCSRQDWLGFPY